MVAAPASPAEGESITLTASVTNPSGSILRYRWDFGDGEPSESGEGRAALTHTYRDDGRFTVTVTVSDADGATAEGTTEVEVTNEAPAVEVLTGPDEAATGEPAVLEGLARDPGVDDVLTYRWDFGDGETAAGEDLRRTTHAFAAPGVYTVELSVTDDGDLSDTRVVTVSVDRTFRFDMSGAVGGTIEGGFEDRPGFLAHGGGDSREIPDGYCQLTVTAGDEGKMVILAGQLPEPIEPGVYPVARRGGPGTVAVQDLQCGNPGVDCSGGLWRGAGVSGSLRLTEVTAERIAGELSAGMQFGDAAYQITGSFVSAPSSMAGIALGLNPACFRAERFAVDTHHPDLDQPNVDPGDPRIEVTFTDDVDPATVNDATFVVETQTTTGTIRRTRRSTGPWTFPTGAPCASRRLWISRTAYFRACACGEAETGSRAWRGTRLSFLRPPARVAG